ncbi:MAG TPA: sigma-70 family RNA polymerase sigma factor [Streptosporangiaceae bacterium]|nr:sigma-70 family RNA polymerase sigma factor [Streptosporangiaceae bacterium]
MDDNDQLARRYEASRPRLRAMAYRMLGSLSDAEDAVQEGWMHASAAGAEGVANLEGWFTTIVARVCLDMLRSRKSRREDPLDPDEAMASVAAAEGPESEALLADSVGLALLVVLDTLPPAERVAFVLHDTFGLPFAEIAEITGRSPAAARQLASRARRRIQGSESDAPDGARLGRQRRVAEAFLAATRGGDLAGLIAVLDPDVVLTSDAAAVPTGVARTVRGAQAVARGARAAAMRSRYGRIALVNGAPGLIMAPGGRLVVALAFTFAGDRITGIDVIADAERLAGLNIALLDPTGLG